MQQKNDTQVSSYRNTRDTNGTIQTITAIVEQMRTGSQRSERQLPQVQSQLSPRDYTHRHISEAERGGTQRSQWLRRNRHQWAASRTATRDKSHDHRAPLRRARLCLAIGRGAESLCESLTCLRQCKIAHGMDF